MNLKAAHCVLLALAAGCSAPPSSPMPPTVPNGQKPPQAPPPNAVGGFTAELPALTLMPGQELTPCFIVPLSIDGPSRIVGGARLDVGPGLHHGNILTRKHDPSQPDTMRSCGPGESSAEQQAIDVLNGGAVLFGSTTQHAGEEWQSFPAGMGYRVRDGFEIIARMHYLNATNQPLTVQPKYTWYTIDEKTLVQEIAPFAWSFDDFAIPPQGDLTVRGECLFTESMHVVSVLPHMHKLGTAFRAGFLGGPLDGKSFLDSPGYDPENSVIEQYDPSVDLGQGAGAWFECSWHNTFDKTITYGLGDNEMCILFGYAWPPPDAFTVIAKPGNCVTIGNGAP